MTQILEIVERLSPLLLELHDYAHLLRIKDFFLVFFQTMHLSHWKQFIVIHKRSTPLLIINKNRSAATKEY